jgi:hypothetical protein
MKKNIYIFTFTAYLFLLCIGLVLLGCRETTVSVLNQEKENCLFVECTILTDGVSKIGFSLMRTGNGYNYDAKSLSLDIFTGDAVDTKLSDADNFILGKKTDLSKNIGGGIIGSVSFLQKLSKTDNISNSPFPGSYPIELVSGDQNGNITVKINNKLISLKPQESFNDSVKVGDCVVSNKYEYTNVINYLTVTNHGFVPKKNVKYNGE